MNDTYYTSAAYLIADKSSDTTTNRAAIGESVIRRPFDPIAVQHGFGRVLRPNFHPTIGRHRQNTPDELQGPGCPTARLDTGRRLPVGCNHRTRQRQLDCLATTKGRRGEKAPSRSLTRASTFVPYPRSDKMGGGGFAHGC
jgi:hypothetical protein